MKLKFLPAGKPQRFHQIDTIILCECGQACPNTQNNKFAISLQYLKKEVSDEVAFLYANEPESLLQIDTMVLMGMVKLSQSSQNKKLAILKRS